MENKITPNFQLKNRYLMIIILAVYILYGFSWIKDSSFIVEEERYFCLADDMMVSMRYAKNLSNGYGLVWNQNDKEKVEGYSNFLWVLLMTVFHSLPFALSKISIFIQLSALLFLVLNLIIIRKITRIIFKDNDLIWIGTIILTAFYYPLNFWSFAGYEVSILTLLLNLSIYLTLKDKGVYKFNWLPALIMGISFLIRMEMIILFAVMIFFPFIIRKKKNR